MDARADAHDASGVYSEFGRNHAPTINRCNGQDSVAVPLLRRSNPKTPKQKFFMTQ